MIVYGQRAFMRKLVAILGHDEYEVCLAYADAEQQGQVPRLKNAYSKTADEYATALWRDGVGKGWL